MASKCSRMAVGLKLGAWTGKEVNSQVKAGLSDEALASDSRPPAHPEAKRATDQYI